MFDWENSFSEPLCIQIQRQVPTVLSDSEKGFPLGRPMRRGILSAKNLPELSPILVSPSEGELLTLYLVVSDFLTSAALVGEQDRVQQSVYYYRRALRGAEERYPQMEKLILALVTTARRLRPYFQAHTIEIPIEHPMKHILHKPETLGRLIKWAIELSEFDIRYKPRTAIKGQVLAYFIMQFTPIKYLGEAHRNYSISTRLAHLEVVRRWGCQSPRKRGESDSDPKRD